MSTSRLSCLKDEDREFFDRELSSFLPDRIFDAHTHLWRLEAMEWGPSEFRGDVGLPEYLDLMEDLHPGREKAAMFIPFTTPQHENGLALANEWVAKQIEGQPSFRGIFFIRPEDDPEWVRQEVRRLGLCGLKCYHTFSSANPTWEASIPEFLPEAHVKVAHEEGWVITLHMVKSRAVADPDNIHWIRHYCETYPNMKLILAHSARGFQPAHNLEGLPKLTGLDNLYFDTSVNCEPIAHQAIIRLIGHDKLMYGTDLPVSHERGRSLAAGDSFIWLYEKTPVWGEKHLKIPPLLVGLEHLRSIKWACWSEGLSDSAVEDIFWNNAAKLFGVS